MGRVYLAEDTVLGRRTAIKFVSERMSADPDSRARFLREARTMASVEHAHVVRVYSFTSVMASHDTFTRPRQFGRGLVGSGRGFVTTSSQ